MLALALSVFFLVLIPYTAVVAKKKSLRAGKKK